MEQTATLQTGSGVRLKFILGGLLILAAVVYLIFSSTNQNKQFFFTVEELNARGGDVIGKDVRVSGAVIGDTIQYDPKTLTLSFEVAHVPGDNTDIDAQGGLAEVLHAAVIDTSRQRLRVVYIGVKPDLLRNEAQAIMAGQLKNDGTFYVHPNELLLKCPTKYEEAVPDQAES